MFYSRKSKIETAIIMCVVSYVALCICIPCVIEGRGCIVLIYRVHECDSSLQYDFSRGSMLRLYLDFRRVVVCARDSLLLLGCAWLSFAV